MKSDPERLSGFGGCVAKKGENVRVGDAACKVVNDFIREHKRDDGLTYPVIFPSDYGLKHCWSHGKRPLYGHLESIISPSLIRVRLVYRKDNKNRVCKSARTFYAKYWTV